MEVHSIETIVRALNEAGVQYLIVGGVAVNAHGFVRLTRDVDLVLRLERENAVRGLNALLRAGWRLAIPKSRRPLPTRRRASAGGRKKT